MLHSILLYFCVTGEVPQQWKDTIIKTLLQKNGRIDANTSRGIPLVAHAGKVLPKIVASRFSNYCETEELVPEEQCGFRLARSTIGILLVVRQLQELGQQRKPPLYVCFIDLQKRTTLST